MRCVISQVCVNIVWCVILAMKSMEYFISVEIYSVVQMRCVSVPTVKVSHSCNTCRKKKNEKRVTKKLLLLLL